MLQQSTLNSLKVKTEILSKKPAVTKNKMKMIEMKNYYKIKRVDELNSRVEKLED